VENVGNPNIKHHRYVVTKIGQLTFMHHNNISVVLFSIVQCILHMENSTMYKNVVQTSAQQEVDG
jgi:hypothetical protein